MEPGRLNIVAQILNPELVLKPELGGVAPR